MSSLHSIVGLLSNAFDFLKIFFSISMAKCLKWAEFITLVHLVQPQDNMKILLVKFLILQINIRNKKSAMRMFGGNWFDRRGKFGKLFQIKEKIPSKDCKVLKNWKNKRGEAGSLYSGPINKAPEGRSASEWKSS